MENPGTGTLITLGEGCVPQFGVWYPIHTAPKYEGARMLGYGQIGFETDVIGTVKYNPFRDNWYADPSEATEYEPVACKLTHWMPLPEMPGF